MNGESETCCCQYKSIPREAEELKKLKNRLNRMIGQLNGIGKMLEENRYCGDILMQVAAVENALQSFGYLILQNHLETCVSDKIKNGEAEVIDEAMYLIKKIK